MRIDCHVHTTRYSPCSRLSPYKACSLALERGLQALVITEHHQQWHPGEIREMRNDFPGLSIYSGLEVSLAEGFDVVVITRNQGLEIPPGLPCNEVFTQWIKDAECFAFLAHAFRWGGERTKDLSLVLPYVHGLEMNSLNILEGQHAKDNRKYVPLRAQLYDELRQEHSLVPLYNSDAHLEAAVGCLANDISCPAAPEDEAELIELLKSSTPVEFQNEKRLAALLDSLFSM
jgi:hypothetical protein